MDYYAFWKKKKQKLNYELFFNFLPFFFHIIINAQKRQGSSYVRLFGTLKYSFSKKKIADLEEKLTHKTITLLYFSPIYKKKCMCLFEKAYQKIFFLD